ncbi:MAG: hypothetical protein M4579_000349 [Chaenotheca gracillima]|nr:MAG: hypothetical protein M4579_000349 [Chaenotheca gracillima]
MAPTKKKKKVAANPARGFATTSIAKKPEGIEVANLPEAPSSHTGSTTKLESRDGQGMPGVNGVEEKRQDLTPEEYEKELEASELQTIVDRFGGKVRKDAARQVAKLRTDRRQLRSQADPMNTVQWLPPELLNRALNLINKENEMATHQPVLDRGQSLKNIQEDEQLARLWTLQEILLKLGISRNIVQEMERYALQIGSTFPQISLSNSDSIWGLNEALEWLASQCIASDLPDYEREQSKSTSEGPTVSSSGDDEAEGHIQNFSTERKREILQDTDDHPDEGSPAPETGESHDEFQNDLLSEMDSDLEPGELLSNYLSTKSSLYLLEPGTIATSVAKKKSNKGGQKRSTPKLPKAKALQRRLQKIESDILFDQDEADRAWPQRKIDLDIEQAHLKKARSVEKDSTVPGDPQGLADRERQDNEDIAAPEIFMKAEAQAKEDLETPELSEGDEMLGGLFPDNPDSSPVSTNQPVDASTPNSQGVEMTIRDFGKWTGISPRRVLEEACRSRDSKALLCFRHVSSTSFSHRHSVTISWSKDQDVPNFVSLHGVKVTLRPRETIISMISLSTPDSSQSESFLSTAALFVIFSSSPKEEKSFLRLPGVWKDLWTEFAETKKNYLDQNDRRTLEELREILRDSNANSNDLKDTDKDPLKIESPNKNIDGKDNTGVSIPSLEETSTPSVHLQNVWERIDSSNEYRNMLVRLSP